MTIEEAPWMHFEMYILNYKCMAFSIYWTRIVEPYYNNSQNREHVQSIESEGRYLICLEQISDIFIECI